MNLLPYLAKYLPEIKNTYFRQHTVSWHHVQTVSGRSTILCVWKSVCLYESGEAGRIQWAGVQRAERSQDDSLTIVHVFGWRSCMFIDLSWKFYPLFFNHYFTASIEFWFSVSYIVIVLAVWLVKSILNPCKLNGGDKKLTQTTQQHTHEVNISKIHWGIVIKWCQ